MLLDSNRIWIMMKTAISGLTRRYAMSRNRSTCRHCGKPLTNQVCFACNGSGFSTELAFIKRECTACRGSGWVWRCEDEFKHIVDDFKASHEALPKSKKPSKHSRSNETRDSSATVTLPWQSVNPENPWNSNVLNVPLITASPHAVKNPSQRAARKTRHKK